MNATPAIIPEAHAAMAETFDRVVYSNGSEAIDAIVARIATRKLGINSPEALDELVELLAVHGLVGTWLARFASVEDIHDVFAAVNA